MPGDSLPEAARVVHVERVHQLVNQQVAHHVRPLKQETAIETDGAASRATSPARALATDNYPLEAETQLAGALFECRRQNLLRALHQPATQQKTHPVLVAGIAAQR